MGYPAHTGLSSLSIKYKKRRIIAQELILGCPCGVICPLSVSSEFLFLCARRKFEFNRKICRNLLNVYVSQQINACTTHAERQWAGGTFLRQQKKVPPTYMQQVWMGLQHGVFPLFCSPKAVILLACTRIHKYAKEGFLIAQRSFTFAAVCCVFVLSENQFCW